MLWTIRGTDPTTEQDTFVVTEADTAAEAEYFARRRGFPVVVVEQATPADIRAARTAGTLFHYSGGSRYRCFGHPITSGQLVCLMLCGITTIGLLLRAHQLPVGW